MPFRVFTLEQILLNLITIAKHLVVLTVLEYSFCCDFRKKTAQRKQQMQLALYSNSDRSLFEYIGPLSCPPRTTLK